MALFEFTGKWSSNRYSYVHGTVSIELPYFYTENFETTLYLTYNGSYRNGETHSFELQGRFQDNEYFLMSADLELGQLFTLYFIDRDGEYHGQYSCVCPPDTGKMTLECTVTCSGCLEMQANQLGHMDYGGCLWMGGEEEF